MRWISRLGAIGFQHAVRIFAMFHGKLSGILQTGTNATQLAAKFLSLAGITF
jgi:hypothetical protein